MIKGIIFDWIGTLYERDRGLYTFSEQVLRNLRPNYKLGIVSIARYGDDARRAELEQSGVLSLFYSVIINRTKTSEHYLECMKEMGTSPKETAIVDDRTIRGIKIGNELGCPTFWIQTGEHSQEFPNEETGKPTVSINSIKELLGYF